jgi:SpoVK/Ycf46/Vps4 family AAA+-type ATPase
MAASNLSRRMIYKRKYYCIQTCFEFLFQSSDAKEGKSKKGQYEGPDMDLAKILERDVLNSNRGVDWDHISGLSDAKRLLFEAIVLPVL